MGASTRVPGSNETPADSDSQSLFTELHVHNLCKQSLKELLALFFAKSCYWNPCLNSHEETGTRDKTMDNEKFMETQGCSIIIIIKVLL